MMYSPHEVLFLRGLDHQATSYHPVPEATRAQLLVITVRAPVEYGVSKPLTGLVDNRHMNPVVGLRQGECSTTKDGNPICNTLVRVSKLFKINRGWKLNHSLLNVVAQIFGRQSQQALL